MSDRALVVTVIVFALFWVAFVASAFQEFQI